MRINELRILGIDPGSLVTGWGLVSGSAASPRLDGCGVIRLGSSKDLAPRLATLQAELAALIRQLSPDEAAVEAPFHGKSSRSALQLAHARGVVLAVLSTERIAVAEYSPAAVKKSVTGSGRADKEQVRNMIHRFLGDAVGGGPHDITDALAVALCHASQASFTSAVRRSTVRRARPAPVRR